ncbi:hypothetical protein DRO03_11880 [Methanosarcinales archaeon]|nr:MAG: hypothetical protein DRO03_11880 [Methanosarcinales archaeon]
MYAVIREKFERIVAENNLLDETVVIRAKPLTPEEAIGNPESEDFPILKGARAADAGGVFRMFWSGVYRHVL